MKKNKKNMSLWFETPFEEFEKKESERKDIFSSLLNFDRLKIPDFPSMHTRMMRPIMVNMGETKEEILLKANIPGFKKDEIKLKITPTSIDISAEKKKERREERKGLFMHESSFGSERRVIGLPVEVLPEKAKVNVDDEILEINLPKKARKKEEAE